MNQGPKGAYEPGRSRTYKMKGTIQTIQEQ